MLTKRFALKKPHSIPGAQNNFEDPEGRNQGKTTQQRVQRMVCPFSWCNPQGLDNVLEQRHMVPVTGPQSSSATLPPLLDLALLCSLHQSLGCTADLCVTACFLEKQAAHCEGALTTPHMRILSDLYLAKEWTNPSPPPPKAENHHRQPPGRTKFHM